MATELLALLPPAVLGIWCIRAAILIWRTDPEDWRNGTYDWSKRI